MDKQLKANITSSELWLRLIYMVFFGVCLQLVRIVTWAVVVLQFFLVLITGGDNEYLRNFGLTLSRYVFQVFKFLTYNSEEKPFPFSDWPTAEVASPEDEADITKGSEA